jgi:ubiquinone/menaquinone biosynthesis C-methylase UbiE
MGAPGRKDDHDFMTDEEIANFLRGPATGYKNNGRRTLVSIVKNLHLGQHPKVLDAACGTAINWETFKDMGVVCDFVGMDRTEKMIDYAEDRYGHEIGLKQGYVQKLPFDDNSFDVVIMRHIFEHLPPGDMERGIAEAIRVASNTALFSFFLPPDGREEHDIQENSSNEGRDGCTHFWNTYSHRRLMEYLTSFGFQVTRSMPILTIGAAHYDIIYKVSK